MKVREVQEKLLGAKKNCIDFWVINDEYSETEPVRLSFIAVHQHAVIDIGNQNEKFYM